VRPDGLSARLELFKAGDRITMLVARRDRLMEMLVTLGPDEGRPWRLEVRPDATSDQRARLTGWLSQ